MNVTGPFTVGGWSSAWRSEPSPTLEVKIDADPGAAAVAAAGRDAARERLRDAADALRDAVMAFTHPQPSRTEMVLSTQAVAAAAAGRSASLAWVAGGRESVQTTVAINT